MTDGDYIGFLVVSVSTLLLLFHAYTNPVRVAARKQKAESLKASFPKHQLREDFEEFWLPVPELADLYNQQQLKEIHDAVKVHEELATKIERAYTLRKMRDAVDRNVGLIES